MSCYLNMDLFKQAFHKFTLDKELQYHYTYNNFISFFEARMSDILYNDFVAGAHMVYGWMPTILKFNHILDVNEQNQLLEIISKAQTDIILSHHDLLVLKKCINNSLVGVSKYLHFINPNIYPIWDSHIARLVYQKNYNSVMQDTNFYLKYLDCLHEIITYDEFNLLYLNLLNQLGKYSLPAVSKVRAIEMVIFSYSKSLKRNKVNIL